MVKDPSARFPGDGDECVDGAAMAEVLARFFGSDDIAFSTTSTTLPGVERHFASFSQAAEENADSRVYIGFHFRHATDEGMAAGLQLGQYVGDNSLQRVRGP